MVFSTSETLKLWINGQRLGSWHVKDGQHYLLYDESWIASKEGRPLSLSLPFLPKNKIHAGPHVHAYFENLLPDRLDVRNRIKDRFKAKSIQAFDLLAEIGRDCIGAVQIARDETVCTDVKKIKALPLSDEQISAALDAAAGIASHDIFDEDFRISLAGAQEKTAFLFYKNSWQKPLLATPSTHIFKLPLGNVGGFNQFGKHSLENEWLCAQILKAFDLPVANAEIKIFAERKALVVERFDRKLSADGSWIIRIPSEDFCQIYGLPSEKKYESDGGPGIKEIIDIISKSSEPEKDLKQFISSLFIFYLLAAPDAHAKNFSIFLEAGGGYRLTPLYDVLSVYPWAEEVDGSINMHKLKMAMAMRRKNAHYRWASVTLEHFKYLLKNTLIASTCSNLFESILEQLTHVRDSVLTSLPATFPANLAEQIISGMLKARDRLSGK